MNRFLESVTWLDDKDLVMRDLLGGVSALELAPPLIEGLESMGQARPTRCFFHAVGVGIALGLELESGRSIMVKLHGAKRPLSFLQAVIEVQRHLVSEGFPAPLPLGDPISLFGLTMTAEDFLGSGELRDAHDPKIRKLMASGLANLIESAKPFALSRSLYLSPTRRDSQSLWPTPHNALFDFDTRSSDTAWIEDLATKALSVVSSFQGADVVGHADWSAKHFRFHEDAISAVYDWDSLVLAPEPVLLGVAAATFPYHETLEVVHSPSEVEIEAFIEEYIASRKTPAASEEIRIARAQAVYSLAYGAKCEVSFVGERVGDEPRYWRDALSATGPSLLKKADL